METFYPLTNNGLADRRYAVRLEWCGESGQRYVLRFCGDWLGSFRNLPSAALRAAGHRSQMRGNPVIVERLE